MICKHPDETCINMTLYGGKIYCDNQYGFCHLHDDPPPMTNADRINAMTIEGKAEFLSSIAYVRETPWSEPFARRMCDSCPTVHGTYEGGIEDDFHECDFVDGKCPHGSAIVWWLQQPAEEDDHDERKENEHVQRCLQM